MPSFSIHEHQAHIPCTDICLFCIINIEISFNILIFTKDMPFSGCRQKMREFGNGGVRNQAEGLEGQDGGGRLQPECKITR